MPFEDDKLADYLLPDGESLDEFSMFDDGIGEEYREEPILPNEEWQPL